MCLVHAMHAAIAKHGSMPSMQLQCRKVSACWGTAGGAPLAPSRAVLRTPGGGGRVKAGAIVQQDAVQHSVGLGPQFRTASSERGKTDK